MDKKIEIAKWLIDPDKKMRLPDEWDLLNKKLEETGLKKIFTEIEEPLVEILDYMHDVGIKVDVKFLAKLSKTLENEIYSLTEEIYKHAGGEFNINSPKQISEVLFEKLEIPNAKLPRTKTGLISTDAESLKSIKDEHPIVGPILKYREIFKLNSTYVIPLQELADKKGRVHTTFMQTGTGTGRLSSQNPNLQNIPTLSEWGKKIREAFVAEKGYSLASFDYSQIELRVLATVTKDPTMTNAFKNDLDIHKLTASAIYNVPIEKVTKTMRSTAKTLNFGVSYGMGPDAFSKVSGLNRAEALKFINEYFSDFYDIKVWQEQTIKKARETGWVENLNGRRRLLPNINWPNRRFAAEAERVAINMPIQGLAADIIKLAMINVAKALKKRGWCRLDASRRASPQGAGGCKVKMLLSIHDELLFEIKDDILKEASKVIQSEMENAYQLAVPLKVDKTIGKNWSDV